MTFLQLRGLKCLYLLWGWGINKSPCLAQMAEATPLVVIVLSALGGGVCNSASQCAAAAAAAAAVFCTCLCAVYRVSCILKLHNTSRDKVYNDIFTVCL